MVRIENNFASRLSDTNNKFSIDNNGDNNLYKEKLVFSPAELGLGNKRPSIFTLTEKQVETKIFQKYGFDTRSSVQMEMLKLRFDTQKSPFSEINWQTNKFVATLNSSGQYEISVGLREHTLEALSGRLIYSNPNRAGIPTEADPKKTTASLLGINSADYNRFKLEQKLPLRVTTDLTPEQHALILDLTQIGLSVVGIFDPTGLADGADALISVGRGDYWGAGISALGIIPYIGDLAKIGKLPKLLKTIERVVDVAKQSPAFARAVEPLLKNLKGALDKLPLDKLPNWAKEPIQSMKNKIDEFFAAGAKNLDETKPSLSPDPNRLPEGNPKKVDKKDVDPDNIRATMRENESAKILAQNGYATKQLPDNVKGSVQNVKKPDFEIEGRVFDNFAPSSSSARNIAGVLQGKIVDPKTGIKQADRFVLNLNDSSVTLDQMEKQIRNFPINGLKEIIIIKNGKVIPFFPFK